MNAAALNAHLIDIDKQLLVTQQAIIASLYRDHCGCLPNSPCAFHADIAVRLEESRKHLAVATDIIAKRD